MSEVKARSPYQRHNKAPYLYSPQYQAWRHAWKTGNHVEHAHEVWEKAHGLRRTKGKEKESDFTLSTYETDSMGIGRL